MLQRIACGSSPILLRCRVASIARTFSQSAAAVQEPAAAAADKNAAMREERISRMEAYVRKHWAEKGTLPKAYILTKEFGGAKSIAPKVLERLEPELKSGAAAAAAAAAEKSSSSPSPSPKLATDCPGEVAGARSAAASAAAQAPETATTPKASDRPAPTPTPSPPTSKPSDASSRPTPAQSKSDNSAEVKEPAINLWGKVHSITYSKPAPAADRPTQAAPPRPASPPRSSFAAQPAPKIRSGNSTEEDDSESESESGSDGDLAPGSEDKNPAQPLFRSDLQPRHGLYVKFLSPQATESDVRSAFRSCGEINRVQVVRSRNPAARYIYGFVDFKTEEGLNAALVKDILIRGVKVQTEPQKNGKEKEKQQKQPKQESESDEERSSKPKTAIAVSKTEDVSLPADKRRCTLALESIPHASLPHIIEALSQYGEVTNSQTKQSPGGNTTAYIEFKNEIEKDNALAASRVILGGKSLRMTRLDTPLTTVVRLSNIPSDERERIVSSYKSYGQVDKVDQRMDGVVDIYYNASEIKNMAKILDKLNGLQASRRKLRAVPAPISHPRSIAELAGTPEGQKWIESQLGIVRKNLALSLAKAAMYSRDLEQLLATTTPVPSSNSIAAN